jgi:hypothetical protein
VREGADLSLPFDFDGLHSAIFLFTLSFDVLGELFVPVTFSFPVDEDSQMGSGKSNINLLLWVEHILQQNRTGLHGLWDIRFVTAK